MRSRRAERQALKVLLVPCRTVSSVSIVNDKLNAVTGLEVAQTLPVIKESDTDWARRVRQFDSIIIVATASIAQASDRLTA